MMVFDLDQRAKPILKWAGGKSQLLKELVACAPAHFERYVEPFLGGAAVFLSLKKGLPAVLADSNPELIHLYKVVQKQPKKLMECLDVLANQYSEEFYYATRAATFQNPVERAARTVFLNKTGFNGLYRQNSKGQFNVPFGQRKKCPRLFVKENVMEVSRRLRLAVLLHADFEEVLNQTKKGDLVYCDPPYEPLSKTASFNRYVGKGFSFQDQERLKDACDRAVERGAAVVVSNSYAPQMVALYSHWRVKPIKATRSINSKADRRGPIRELLAVRFSESLFPLGGTRASKS